MKKKLFACKLIIILFMCFASDNLIACGWWGDGESLMDDESVTVDSSGHIVQNQASDNESPEVLTQRANKLRHYGQSGYSGAARLYRRAAKMGYAPAQNNLGEMYIKGHGVAINYFHAAELFRLAAKQGEAHAQHSLGMMLIIGKDALPDLKEGIQWLEKSADTNHVSAINDLIKLYSDGIFVEKNQNKATYWKNKSINLKENKDSEQDRFNNE